MTYIPNEINRISTLNSLTGGTMAVDGGYTGTSENISNYTTLSVSVYTPFGTNLNGTVWLEVSRDDVNWNTIPRTLRNSSVAQPITFLVAEEYFRLRFENGQDGGGNPIDTVSASTMQMQTMFSTTRPMFIGHEMGETIYDWTGGVVSKSVLTGSLPSGNYANVKVNSEGSLNTSITSPRTAFGELQMAQFTPAIQVSFQYDVVNTDIISSGDTGGGGTISQANGLMTCSTGANTDAIGSAESIRKLKYRAGQGVMARFTAIFTSGVTGSLQKIGIGNEVDGFTFAYSGETFGVIRTDSGTEYFTPQSAWTIDVCDGSGSVMNPSNILLDQTKGNVYQIQFQWLGFGSIKYFIEKPSSGDFTLVHVDEYSNNHTRPSVHNPTLPLHLHAENTTNNTDITLQCSSMGAFVEGEEAFLGPTNAFENTKGVNTETSIFSLSGKTSYGGQVNLVEAIVQMLSVGNETNKNAIFRIWEDCTLGGSPSYQDINTNNSIVQVDTSGTTVSGGKLVYAVVVGKDSGEGFNLKELDIRLRPGHTLTFTCSTVGGTDDKNIAVVWIEDF